MAKDRLGGMRSPSRGDRRRLLAASVASPLALVASGQAWAEPETIRYAGDVAFAPFESLDAQGKPHGFQIDLLSELAASLGLRFDIRLQDWDRTEADFRDGRADLVAMVDTVERRAWAQFCLGHATPAFAVYHPQGQRDPQAVPDLKGKRVAVLDSVAMRDTLKAWSANLSGPLVMAPNAADALAAVQQGTADVALLPRAYADPLLASGAASGLVASHWNLQLQSYAFAVAPTNTALRERLQKGLDELERDGRLEALRVRWLSSHRDVAERDALRGGLTAQRGWTWGVAGVSTVAVALLGYGVLQRGRRVRAEQGRRREAEGALKRAEELLARTFTDNPEPMLIVERGVSVVRDANQALFKLLGTTAEAVIGRSLREQARHLDAQALEQLIQALDVEGTLEAVPLRLRHTDGSERQCLLRADPLVIDGVTQVFCMVRDITEQLARDAAMRAGYDGLVAELAQSQLDLARARNAKGQAEATLSEFTRTVAHDLRAPLNAVYGFIGLLKQRLQAGHVQEALDFSNHIQRAAERMNSMVLALSKLALVSSQPLRRQPVDMQKLAQDTWTLLTLSHPTRRAKLRIEVLPQAKADPDLTAQVWQNLLDNALKYSAQVADAKVSVSHFRDERGTWYRVADNGAGFDMARADRLFQPFQRLHTAQQFEGTGVGLSLVRRILDHHGGEIRLRSSPGVGTVAEFTLDPSPETNA